MLPLRVHNDQGVRSHRGGEEGRLICAGAFRPKAPPRQEARPPEYGIFADIMPLLYLDIVVISMGP